MSRPPIRIAKVGGSLLHWKGLPAALNRWLSTQSIARTILVAGGGPFVDTVRNLDRRLRMSASESHWLAIRTMSLTAAVLSALIREAALIDDLGDSISKTDSGLFIFDPLVFLQQASSREHVLPESWAMTSDSIAAYIANCLQADELVLIKSTLPINCETWEETAGSGFVDEYFPQLINESITTSCLNLRSPQVPSWTPARQSYVKL